ncbi:MAG: GFA family protein [Alphaproteobacteria bacterium]|nr:GFA family protein [Alphaproteobacteria bacterium]
MADHEIAHHGSCLCGAIGFIAAGAPNWVGICHCSTCRRATGGVLMAAAGFSRARVKFSGAPARSYRSSSEVQRKFCGMCGSSLSYENERWPDDIHLMVANFARADLLRPQFHIFAGERLPWLEIVDGLPHYRGTPSEGVLES